MKKIRLLLLFLFISAPVFAQEPPAQTPFIRSVTVEGGPIASEHFQTSDDNYRERHGLGIVKLGTRDYGTWGVYVLSPNSVRDQSFGVGYVTDPYAVPLGPFALELTGALGLVTGYRDDWPVPLLAGEARFVLYQGEAWSVGASMAALPYLMENDMTGDNEFGVVATSPYLSIRYDFQ